ncbi:MAG: aldo/keto reductase [Candidatus Zixiibacteriota bacterium]|nr:MAG: aldo/keto reductase [candidate division Zixibacteria bacterium]
MKDNGSDVTRRKFLAAAASGLAAAGLAGFPSGAAIADEEKKPAEKASKKIIYRQLGKTDIRLPIVSMGVMNANNPEIVQASYEIGVRHFDTAAYYQYGRNEQMVGSVINKLGVRDKVVIGTKVHAQGQRRGLADNESKKKLIDAVDSSLERLKMEYTDILYIHDVSDPEEIFSPGIVEGLGVLKEKKKARHVGVSTHNNMTGIISAIAAKGVYDVVLTAINFTMADDAELLKAIENAGKKGVGIIAMKTQAGGARWPNPESRRDYSSSTIATAALKWVLRNENITTAIPGYTNHEHMTEDFSVAYDLEYTEEEKKLLSDNNIKLSLGFCRQCKKCLASCPNDVDIPKLMRTHMYAAQYGNFHQARATLDEIPGRGGLASCKSCVSCIAQCANTVDIARRVDELKLMYA